MTGNRTLKLTGLFSLIAFAMNGCGTTTKSATEDTGFDLGLEDSDDTDEGTDDSDDNAAPTVTIESPSNGDVLDASNEIEFFAVVSDDNDDPSLIEITWSSDRSGEFSDSPANSSGAVTATTTDLEAGTHIVTLTAVDRDGLSNTDTVTIRVENTAGSDDGGDEDVLTDIDGDGVTAEDGDCNDEDPLTYPGADEPCNGEDNNCDGIYDSEFWDEYEPNENMGSAFELGEIDEDWFSWGTASLEVTDVSFDSPTDEDWFTWFADDDPGDDPNISISIEGDADMYFIVEMYVEEWDTTTPMATVEGWESVFLDEENFEFEGGWWWADFSWDNIYVRVRTDADAWDEITCEEGTYDILIES